MKKTRKPKREEALDEWSTRLFPSARQAQFTCIKDGKKVTPKRKARI